MPAQGCGDEIFERGIMPASHLQVSTAMAVIQSNNTHVLQAIADDYNK